MKIVKQTLALTLALTMALSLAACGGKTDRPSSSSTPPATQGEPSQPNSTPDDAPDDIPDDTQPGEPADTTPSEPQNNAGTLPEGGFYLHDGVHYLTMISDPENISSTVISGEKAANTVHEIYVEQGENPSGRVRGSMSVGLGQTAEPFDYQISFVNESDYVYELGEGEFIEFNGIGQIVAPMETACFTLGETFSWVVNPSDAEKTAADCPLIYLNCPVIELNNDTNGKVTLDGQSIEKLDDLLHILGTPTAAYTMDSAVYYIWQFEDFIYTAGIGYDDYEEIFDEERQVVYINVNWDFSRVSMLSCYALNYNLDEINLKQEFELWATAWPVQALTDLGLL